MAALDQVQVLDEQIAAERPVAQQGLHGVERGWIGLASLGGDARLAAAPTGRLHHRP
jgi:hypothetical protein